VAGLVLGPLLRYAGTEDATIWVETDAPCRVEVTIEGADACARRTFAVEGHHYALLHCTGLQSDSTAPYEVRLDGETVWPEADSPFPPSVVRTHSGEEGAETRILFGSCRVAAPHEPPHTLRKDEHPDGREVDALRGLALAMMHLPPEEWPHALVLLGDQIYADEVHPDVEEKLDSDHVETFDDYVDLYVASWGEPVIRWLLSTVPSAMIFDDHDVHDDWNTSIEWVTEMREKAWWRRRIVAAFESYLIYQHLGNLSPTERNAFELYRQLREGDDPTERLREFARRADEEVEGTRWSFCRDIGTARVVMIDSRAGRVLEPGRRAMVDADEWAWIAEHARGDVDHLVIGTSLPLIMGPALHNLEAWNELVADGAWGRGAKRIAEKLRQALDLEHWPAFQESFRRMCEHLREVGAGEHGAAPSTIVVLSGDVHHAYLAEIGFPAGSGVSSSVWQAVCSPFRNPLDANERRVILAAWTRTAGLVTRALARLAGVRDPDVGWRLAHDAPWYTNQVAALELDGRRATFVLEKAIPPDDGEGEPRLERVFDRPIEPNVLFARP
jgi:hypothetical protein